MTDTTSTQPPHNLPGNTRARPPLPPLLTGDELRQRASEALNHHILPPIRFEIAVELTASHPWDANGWLDFLQPGRWNAEFDYVNMAPIVHGEHGEEEGTAGYVHLTAPDSLRYTIAVQFSGFSSGATMHVNGPWGTTSAHAAGGASGAVVAEWNATAGQSLDLALECKGDDQYGSADVRAIQLGTWVVSPFG
jgi:hypothetical protein